MGVKYTIPYKSYQDEQWRIDILHDDFVDDPIVLRGVRDQSCVITYNNSDDPYQAIVNSTASISIIKHDAGLIDIRELQEAEDKDFKVEVYREESLYWTGFIIPDGIQESFQSLPFDVKITATDGLKLLSDIDFTGLNNWPMPDGVEVWSPLAFVRELFVKLGLLLPIRWVNTLECLAFPGEDSFAGSVVWSPQGMGYTDYNGNYKSCMYVLEGLLMSHQMRIYQSEGRWKLERINDIVTGSYSWKEMSAVHDAVEVPVITTGTENGPSFIGSGGKYGFINEDAILTVMPGLKGVKTTYKSEQRENILPNGNQDIISLGQPIYWGVDAGSRVSTDSITGREGNATELDATLQTEMISFRLEPSPVRLPIDTYMLFKKCRIGFIYSLSEAPVDVDGNIVKVGLLWPLSFAADILIGSTRYNLTGSGSWVEPILPGGQALLSANPRDTPTRLGDITSVVYSSSATADQILLPQALNELTRNDVCEIRVSIFLLDGCKATVDEIYINIDENNDVYESTLTGSKYTMIDEREINISSSFSGFLVSNLMTHWSKSDEEFEYTDGRSEGSLTKINSEAIMRFRNKSSVVFNGSIYGTGWKYGEIYNIETLEGKNFLSLQCSYNTERCTANIVAAECRDDNISLDTIHYGSNDKPLSN